MGTNLTLNNAEELQVVLEGCPKPVKLVPALSKGGNVYWTTPGKPTPYGVAITPQAKALPTKAHVVNPKTKAKSESFDLATGVTNDLRPRVSGGRKMALPTRGRDERLVEVRISVRKDGAWNLKVSARGTGGGSVPQIRDADIFG